MVCIFLAHLFAARAQNGDNVPSVIITALLDWGEIMGGVVLIVGLCFYARAKGYNAALGLLGFLSCIGLLILAVLP